MKIIWWDAPSPNYFSFFTYKFRYDLFLWCRRKGELPNTILRLTKSFNEYAYEELYGEIDNLKSQGFRWCLWSRK